MKCLKVFLSLYLVFQSLFFITPTANALTSDVVISQVLAGNSGAATQEFITIYNNSSNDIDITGWCLENKSNVKFACIDASASIKVYLPAHRYAKVASTSYADTYPITGTDHYDKIFSPNSQSSGSIVGSNDTIKLSDKTATVIDVVSWNTSLAAGSIWQRITIQPDTLKDTDATDILQDFTKVSQFIVPASGTFEVETVIDVCPNLTGVQSVIPLGYLADEGGQCIRDQCLNIAGLQADVPNFYDQNAAGNCYEHDECNNLDGYQHMIPENYNLQNGECKLTLVALQITEILPNGAGSDTGHEFIEIYNPTDQQIDLAPYVIRTGVNADKTYNFPLGARIGARQYVVFYDNDMKFSLLNTLGRVTLGAIDGTVLDQTDSYDSPADDMAWAIINGMWQYTDQPTPGVDNKPSLPEDEVSIGGNAELAPCPAGKYRNPLTNRCRSIETDVAVFATCDTDQYRNPETGRCRKIVAAAVTAPCKEGQYRSEATNRCRNITAASVLQPCAEGQERNPTTNRCRNVAAKSVPEAAFAVQPVKDSAKAFIGWWALGGIGIIALGYAGWEWRREVIRFIQRILTIKQIKK